MTAPAHHAPSAQGRAEACPVLLAFWHLLLRSIALSLTSRGTTALAVLIAVLGDLLRLLRKGRKDGWATVMKEWKEELGFLVAYGALAWLVVLAVSMITVTYNDHMSLVGRNAALGSERTALRSEIQSLKNQNSVKDEMLTALRNAPPKVNAGPSKVVTVAPEFVARHRADAQRELGSLLSEGMKLTECYNAKAGQVATQQEIEALTDWEQRARASVAENVTPSLLDEFDGQGNVSVEKGHENWLSTYCWATRMRVFGLRSVMAKEFSPVLSEAEQQRQAQARAELGNMLGRGKQLYQKYCTTPTAIPAEANTAIAEWEGQALSIVAGKIGPEGMEQWEQADHEFPSEPTTLQQKCQKLDERLRGLGNVIRLAARPR
jgi:hypothetical protein